MKTETLRTERNPEARGVGKQAGIREGKVTSPFLPPADPPFKFLDRMWLMEGTKPLRCTVEVGGCGRDEASPFL